MLTFEDDFAGLLEEDDTPEELIRTSNEYIENFLKFKSNNIVTYSGVKKDNIIDCISIEKSQYIPHEHTVFTIDIGKLRDISKPRLSHFSIPDFIEEIRGTEDSSNSGFGYNEFGRNHIQSIMVPTSTYVIANNCFCFYRKLESVVFTEGSRLSIIGDNAFAFCENLHELEFVNCKKLRELKQRLFFQSNIHKLGISGNLRRVAPNTFDECNIKTIYIDGVKHSFKNFRDQLENNGFEAFWV